MALHAPNDVWAKFVWNWPSRFREDIEKRSFDLAELKKVWLCKGQTPFFKLIYYQIYTSIRVFLSLPNASTNWLQN